MSKVVNCPNCGKEVEIEEVEKYNFDKISLESYEKYINFAITRCPHCNYISEDFETDVPPENINEVLNSTDYKLCLNYEYYNDISGKEFLEQEMVFNINEYDAFALICEHKNDYDSLIKTFFKLSILSKAQHKRFKCLSTYKSLGEKYIEICERLRDHIAGGVCFYCFEIIREYEQAQKNNIYTNLIVLDAFIETNNFTEARKMLEKIKDKLDDEFINRIEEAMKVENPYMIYS